MRTLVLSVTTMAVALLAACATDDSPPPSMPTPRTEATTTPAATPTRALPEGLTVGAAAPPAAVFAADAVVFPNSIFVLEGTNGLVRPLGLAFGSRSDQQIVWVDDDTLGVTQELGGRGFEVDVEGSGRAVGVVGEARSAKENYSPSGKWSTGMLASGAGGVIVSLGDRDVKFRISTFFPGYWSPTDDVLAMQGNRCRGFDLFVFDPVAVTLTNLTSTYDRIVGHFVWEPDGGALTAYTLAFGGDDASLSSFDAATGESDVLLALDGEWTMYPLAWNPSGTRLLFTAGRYLNGLCGNMEYEETVLDTVPNLGGP